MRKSSNAWRLDGIDKSRLRVADLNSRSEIFDAMKDIRPDAVCHTASYGVYPTERDRDKTFGTNLLGTMNLLDACIAAGTGLFINTGSCSEYGTREGALEEDGAISPKTDYSVSKALATQYCSYRGNNGTKTVTLRLFTAYGYYEERQRLMPYLAYCSIKKKVAKVSSLKNVRDFVFIEDIENAYEHAITRLDKIPSGSVFNIGSGVRHTVGEVIKEFAGLDFEVDQKIRENEAIRKWQADMTNAELALAWKPKVSLREGIGKTLEWMRENIELYENDLNSKSKTSA